MSRLSRHLWGRRRPERPRGVRLVYPGGREVPVDLEYFGVDGEGLHRWLAVVDADLPPPVKIRADMVPGRTAITISARGEEPS